MIRKMKLLSVVSSSSSNKICSFWLEGSVKESNGHEPGSLLLQQNHVRVLKKLVPSLVSALLVISPICITPVSLGQTVDIERGASLFRRTCIGCHDSGGNIIQPGATLFTKDLVRNGVDSEEEIYRVTYFGKGRMPGFGENCTPRGQCTFGPRLQEDDIKLLAKFVKSQADQGWPPIPNIED